MTTARLGWTRTLLLGGAAALLATALFWVHLSRFPTAREPQPPADQLPFARAYVRSDRPIEYLLNVGDGQAFAALATDPTLSRPELFSSPAEAAYRAQRPVLGWLVWLTSGGDRELVPWSLAAWTMAGIGLLVGATAWTAERLGRVGWPALLLVVAPGVYSNIQWLGPEAAGTGLAILGLGLWSGRVRRRWAACACFIAAALCRETLLLVPASLAMVELVGMAATRRQVRPGARQAVRRVVGRLLPLTTPAAVLGGWLLMVRARYGAWSFEANTGRLGLPFAGVIERFGVLSGSDRWLIALTAAAAVTAFATGWARLDRAGLDLLAVTAGFVILAVLMGPYVWQRWQDFSRPLLPLFPLAVLGLAPCRSTGKSGGPERVTVGQPSDVVPCPR